MNKLGKILEKVIRASKKSREWRSFVYFLAAVVVFTTTYALILPAITVEKSKTDSVGGLVVEEADQGSMDAGAEASGDVHTAKAQNEAVLVAAAEEVREPYNGEVQTIGDRRVMFLRGEEFDVVVSSDLFSGVSDGTTLSVRGIPDANVVKAYSDRISDELLKIFVDTKSTEILYRLVFTDENSFEYTPAGYFDVEFIFHNNTVGSDGEMIYSPRFDDKMVYAAVYDYLTDEMILAEKNGDQYETPVISLDKDGFITGITLKGLNFYEFSDIITLVGGPENEELKLAAERTESTPEESPEEAESTPEEFSEETESTPEETTEGTESRTEETTEKTESKTEGSTEKEKTPEESKEAEGSILRARGSDYTVTLTYSEKAEIPDKAVLEVKEVGTDTDAYIEYLEQAKAATGLDKDLVLPKNQARFFEMRIMADGKEVVPAANVNISIKYDASVVEPDSFAGSHLDTYAVCFGKKEAQAVVVTRADAGSVEFEVESLSVCGVIHTVNFYRELDGKIYEFSMPGGGFVSLEHLVEVLGINKPAADAGDASDSADSSGDFREAIDLNNMEVGEAAKQLVADVANVEFSSPDLVWVGKADETTTVGSLKEENRLKVEYAAELTKEQTAEIDAETVGAGDWALISMQPFISEETLTVTMKNGDQFTVKVTDAQLKKKVISASGETYEVIVTYDDNAQIPEGASLKITEFAEDSKEYQAAREAVVNQKQSEDFVFDEKEFGVAAFDLSIVDKDGNQVEPKAAVDVSMNMKSLPEEAVEKDAQCTIEIHHLNESSGDVAVETVASAFDGSIQVEEETAKAEFQLESFSTFTVSWNRRGTSNNSTTFGWADGTNAYNSGSSRGYITAVYTDESGNAITRPDSVSANIRHYNFNSGVTDSYNILSDFGKSIQNYSFNRAYVLVGEEGQKVQQQVDSVTATRNGDVTSVTYYYNGEEVLSASYDATNVQNKRHDFTPDGLGLTLEYTKNNNFTTIHYGYMDDGTFVEFDEQPDPTNTSTSFGWAHLIYDFVGTDDQGLPVDWKYKGTYYHTSETTNPQQGGTTMQPILRYYNNAWRYYNGNISSQNDTRNNSNWKAVADDSDIYVVYEKPDIPMGGTPSPSENSPQPDNPYILKESVSNTDGTNTLSLSVTGSRKPMITDKVADVIVILDLSSSMRRDIGSQTAYDSNYQTVTNSRYYQAKNAVQKLAERLYAVNGTDGEQYRMGLITFSNYAGRTYLSPTENQSTFQSTLDGITAYEGSGTNWEHALQLANQMSVASDRATYIVFITDGEPSVRQTRGNLTNEQLSGANWTNNPAIEGDIFHGGLAGGQFFPNNNDHNTPDFRDYFGSATFGGLMNNDVWDPRNRNAAVDEVASMLGHNKGFYAIGVSSEVNYLGDFAAASGVDTNHYKLVTSATAFDEVIDDILEELDINGVSGQANIKMFDGITDLTQTISKVNQTEDNRLLGVDGDFKYYKSTAPADWSTWTTAQKAAYALGVEYANSSETPTEYASYTSEEIDAYNLGKDISFTEWTTRAEDGCAAAVYNTETGAVEWNMGQKFMLEDGVTYKVSFICWPSQEAYDIIAKLNNGTITFGDTDLYPQEIWDQFEGDLTNGYTLKTNAERANTKYSKATDVNGNVTVGDEQDPLPFQHVPPMPLDKDKLNVAKTWQASRIDSQTPESVILQVVGDDELYKQFEITPTETVDGSDTPNKGRSENIYISCGHLKVNKSTGEVVIYESGHDFTLREVGENSRHWDLDASICRPMKINMEETMLVLVEEDDIPNAMKTNPNLAYFAENGNEYYRVDGNVYKVDEALTDITGFNTRRSFLDLSKEVLVDNEVWPETVDEVFTYKIKFNIDPTTLSWDPDLEKYIIISTRDANGTVLPSSILALTDAEYTPTAKLPSACGFEESNNTKYLVAENDVEFYLSIKNGWSVRFLNLPAGTTYSIEEVLPEDSNYDFNNVRLETRKDSSSATPVSTDTYTTMKLDGSIAETSTLYKVVYRNAAKTKEVQILKTGQDASTSLGGAKFDLYTESAYTSNPKGTPFKTNLVSSSETATKGKIDLGELPIGKYYLVETKAPDGYNMRTEPVIITVSKTSVTYDDGTTLSQSGSGISQIGDVYQLKVTNDEGVTLPNAGGPGTRLFTILGSILILGVGVLLWRRRRTI